MIKLSVLIASTEDRKRMTEHLMLTIKSQFVALNRHDVEVITDWHPTDCVGIKRNRLLRWANGDYIVFIDSDDKISPNYIERILSATESNPDCIGINGIITMNNGPQQQWFISKEYGSWYQDGGIYYRTPNHISPVRRELALLAGFPEISFGEDYAYSMALLPHLKSEVLIDDPLYHYIYQNK